MKLLLKYLICTLMLSGTFAVSAQQRVRIAGLEDNPEYRSLAANEESLSRMSDSITRSMNEARRAFRTDTLGRTALTASILRMEHEMFDVRNRMAHITGQINTLEQEWILRSLESAAPETAGTEGRQTPETTSANLVYNGWFDANLGPEELGELRRAQDDERLVPPLVAQYRENIARLKMLKAAYALAPTAETAESIKIRFDSLALINKGVDSEIATAWGAIFDDKSYAYNFLMDKTNNREMLGRWELGLEKMRGRQSELQGLYASDAIAGYTVQKSFLTAYEATLAEDRGLSQAADSLGRVARSLPDAATLESLEQVVLRERLFLDFSDITIHSTAQYNAKNPIPEVRVYPKGIIYRVLLGTSASVQQPSVFRGAAPLAVQKGADGKYRCFAGGFPNDSTATAAVERMRKAGFRAPRAVTWMDGVYIDPADEDSDTFYRIEIWGVDELPAGIREVIRTVTDGKDILRADDRYIVAPLDNSTGSRLRTALDGRDPSLEIKITEISR